MKSGNVDRCFAPGVPVPGSLCMLRAIWQVDADSSYQIRLRNRKPMYLLIRTVNGSGTLGMADGSTLLARPDEALLIFSPSLCSYKTEKKDWHFFWFEFDFVSDSHHSTQRMTVPNRAWEIPFFGQLQMLSGLPDEASARAASELFGGFLASLDAEQRLRHQSDRRMIGILEFIAEQSPHIPPVCELARRSGLCERQFRTLFLEETGQTPKQYCEKLRLQLAVHLVSEGILSMKEIGDMLGYSTQFAFSSAFRKRYGASPSKYIKIHLP